MSFPTFSGSSRRPRNVNLSGQKSLNPFAAASWTPSSSSGASKTVADAQAERRQRQQERDKLKASQNIQRIWRGHRIRRTLKESRRHSLDSLYADSSISNQYERSRVALPLILATCDSKRHDDRLRLEKFGLDLGQTQCQLVHSEQSSTSQLRRLARLLIAVIQRSNNDEVPKNFLIPLNEIITARFEALQGSLDQHYEAIATCCRAGRGWDAATLGLLEKAVLLPLSLDIGLDATSAFVLFFLTQHDLELFEDNSTSFAERVDAEKLSAVILEAYSTGRVTAKSTDERLWLLAHFIALQRGQSGISRAPSYLSALYTQLSGLHLELKARHVGRNSLGAKDSDDRLPPFVEQAIESLVERDEISNLLERFTSNYAGSSQHVFEEDSLLAAYILTLIRCFPALSDDIRMRLYSADISSQSGKLVSVKFFWGAMMRTNIFSRITSNDQAALSLLQGKDSTNPRLSMDAASWDREWRTIFLFLELYIFVLRLTDDEDFFSAFTSSHLQGDAMSRLRACMLTMAEVKSLTLFLRNLAFTLYYNEKDLLRTESSGSNRDATTLDDMFNSSDRSTAKASEKAVEQLAPSYDVISGVDFTTFRDMITSAMRMLYERDSRRQFLPANHWLMTSKFDMDGFLTAVVLENQQRQELGEAGSGDEDAEGDDEDTPEQYHSFQAQRLSRFARMEKMRSLHKKTQRKRMLAAIGPKLEILRNMPFVIPFETRVRIFRQFVHLDKDRRRGGDSDPENWRMRIINQFGGGAMGNNQRARETIGRHHAKIRRGKSFQDAFDQFYELGEGLKEPIQITFVDQFDAPEAGIDGGGVTKEFLTSVTKEAFADDLSLFMANSKNSLYPNPSAYDQRQEKLRQAALTPDSAEWNEITSDLLEQYEFLGRIIGKCMYEGILIDVVFAGFFLLKWTAAASDAGYRSNINDLKELDEEFYQGMIGLKNYPGDIAELSLDFTIEDQVSMPGEPVRTITRNLIANGDKIAVTNENRPLYISYMARHRLAVQPHRVTRAFLKGLGNIIDPSWLSMFNQMELQRLVGGDSSEIDIDDLRRNTVYSGLYEIGDDGLEHPTIQHFWAVMRELKDSERRDVLKYVTSTPRAPLLGFSQLSPRFSIRDGGNDQERLPSASTCVNLLKLPIYSSAETLKNKLIYAVSSNAGFDLS